MTGDSLLPSLVFFAVCKDGRQTVADVERVFSGCVQQGGYGRQLLRLVVSFARKGGAQGRQQGTVCRQYDVFFFDRQIVGKGLAQRRDECQRASAEKDRPPDFMPVGEGYDR